MSTSCIVFTILSSVASTSSDVDSLGIQRADSSSRFATIEQIGHKACFGCAATAAKHPGIAEDRYSNPSLQFDTTAVLKVGDLIAQAVEVPTVQLVLLTPNEEVSADNRWVQVEYQALAIRTSVLGDAMPEAIRFIVNGRPAHPDFLNPQSNWEHSSNGVSRVVRIDCPQLGRLAIQAEVQVNGQWQGMSVPLRIEVVPPARPIPIAVGTIGNGIRPIAQGAVVSILDDSLIVRFAMQSATGMHLDFEDGQSLAGQRLDECCFSFELRTALAVGRHRLSFRRLVGEGCTMTSQSSEPIWIDFQPTGALTSVRNENALRRRALVRHVEGLSRSEIDPTTDHIRELVSHPSENAATLESDKLQSFNSSSRATNEKTLQPATVPSHSNSPLVPVPQSGMNVEPDPTTAPANPESIRAPQPGPPKDPAEAKKSILESGDSTKRDLKQAVFVATAHQGATLPMPVGAEQFSVEQHSADESLSINELSWRKHLALGANRSAVASSLVSQLGKLESDYQNAEDVWKNESVVSKIAFDAPAYFPTVNHGSLAQEDARAGLTILEGMMLCASANGNWRLEFTTSRPVTPVTLHLQLQFRSDRSDYWKTLTLEPIRLTNRSESDDPATVRVITGFSPALARNAGLISEVRRRGVAQLGHTYDELLDRRGF